MQPKNGVTTRRVQCPMRDRDADIKAPDGFLLGGIRRVRKDATVLFQRDYWRCPIEWIGEEIWLHDCGNTEAGVEAWPPGVRIWSDKAETIILRLADRPSAKPGFRNKYHKAWAARVR